MLIYKYIQNIGCKPNILIASRPHNRYIIPPYF